MSESMTNLMTAVGELAALTGRVALDYYRGSIDTEIKADGTPVTIADRAAERAAREWIASRFPDDGITGEEFGGGTTGGRRRWLIDPIDGTKSFIRGVPLWGSVIAVCDGDEVLAGAVNCPAVGEMMIAARGEGCWLNGSRAQVSSISSLAQATVLTSDAKFARQPDRGDAWRRLAASAGVARTWGDCYGYLMVASGRAEVMVDVIVADWDIAAVQRCIVEAGGMFTDWDGRPTAFGRSGIATNAALAEEVRRILA